MFGFEKLDVWKKAIDLAEDVYSMTREFPDYEKFGLANQMRRAAVSTSSNIAEGSSRSSNKDFIRFVEIAYGSVMELISQLHIAQRQSFIDTESARDLYCKADEVARILRNDSRITWVFEIRQRRYTTKPRVAAIAAHPGLRN